MLASQHNAATIYMSGAAARRKTEVHNMFQLTYLRHNGQQFQLGEFTTKTEAVDFMREVDSVDLPSLHYGHAIIIDTKTGKIEEIEHEYQLIPWQYDYSPKMPFRVRYHQAWSNTRRCHKAGHLLPYQSAIVASRVQTAAAEILNTRSFLAVGNRLRTNLRREYVNRMRNARNPGHRLALIYSYRYAVREYGRSWVEA